MMIRVMYNDNTYDIVQAVQLDDLIISGRVIKFLRSDGWVTIGRDPIRIFNRRFSGNERRRDTFEMQDAGKSGFRAMAR